MLKHFKYQFFIFFVGILSLLVIADGSISNLNTCERSESEIELEEENSELLEVGQSTISNIGVNSGGSNDFVCQCILNCQSSPLIESIISTYLFSYKLDYRKVEIPFYILYKALKVNFV